MAGASAARRGRRPPGAGLADDRHEPRSPLTTPLVPGPADYGSWRAGRVSAHQMATRSGRMAGR